MDDNERYVRVLREDVKECVALAHAVSPLLHELRDRLKKALEEQ